MGPEQLVLQIPRIEEAVILEPIIARRHSFRTSHGKLMELARIGQSRAEGHVV